MRTYTTMAKETISMLVLSGGDSGLTPGEVVSCTTSSWESSRYDITVYRPRKPLDHIWVDKTNLWPVEELPSPDRGEYYILVDKNRMDKGAPYMLGRDPLEWVYARPYKFMSEGELLRYVRLSRGIKYGRNKLEQPYIMTLTKLK